MNDSQKEVLKYQLEHEKKTLKELKQVYKKAINDTKKKIEMLSARTDLENIQSIVYQKKYQETIKKQLEDILENLNKNQYDTIDKYLNDCYYNGYVGAMYDLHSQGIPLIMPLNQEEITRAVQIDTKLSKPLYEHLNEDTDLLKNRIRANISRGIANGESWNETATKIAKGMNSPFKRAINNAIRIVRTEGHRIQVASSLNAMKDAKEEGADIVKQWCATLDNKTRPLHQQLDGKIAEIDEKFVIGAIEVDAPGHFGLASQDCNCRCCLLQRGKWALDEDELEKLKDRAKFYGLDKSEDFQEFRGKYLKIQDSKHIINSGARYYEIDEEEYRFANKKYKRELRHATLQYNTIKNKNKNYTIKKIAENTGLQEDIVARAFNHVFHDKHQLSTGYGLFKPDFEMAQSWTRLISGNNIQEHDIILVKHEELESKYMNILGLNYKDAHDKTNELYNYDKRLD